MFVSSTEFSTFLTQVIEPILYFSACVGFHLIHVNQMILQFYICTLWHDACQNCYGIQHYRWFVLLMIQRFNEAAMYADEITIF